MSTVKKNLDYDKADFGFWVYLMTDMLLFATLFAAYLILRNATAGGVTGQEIFDSKYALMLTLVLLTSSFTSGLALLGMKVGRRKWALGFLGVTILLGVVFLGLELYEFSQLISEGHTWQHSAFLSAFFALVGTHGLHILSGLIWASVLAVYVWKKGITAHAVRKFNLFALFWHFLDVVWIFIFALVYLLGGLA